MRLYKIPEDYVSRSHFSELEVGDTFAVWEYGSWSFFKVDNLTPTQFRVHTRKFAKKNGHEIGRFGGGTAHLITPKLIADLKEENEDRRRKHAWREFADAIDNAHRFSSSSFLSQEDRQALVAFFDTLPSVIAHKAKPAPAEAR